MTTAAAVVLSCFFSSAALACIGILIYLARRDYLERRDARKKGGRQ